MGFSFLAEAKQGMGNARNLLLSLVAPRPASGGRILPVEAAAEATSHRERVTVKRERLYGMGLIVLGAMIFFLLLNLSEEQRNLRQERLANRINRDKISEQARQMAQMREGFAAQKDRDADRTRHQDDRFALAVLDAERRVLYAVIALTSGHLVPPELAMPGFDEPEA